MKVEVKHKSKTSPGHSLVPGKVYRLAEKPELVIIMVGKKGMLDAKRQGLIIQSHSPESLPIGSLFAVVENSQWIETEATLSLLI